MRLHSRRACNASRFLLAVAAAAALLSGCADPEARVDEVAIPVRVETLARQDFQPTLILLGTLVPAGRVALTAPAAGRLRFPPRFRDGLATGAEVRAGEIVAEIESLPSRDRVSEARLALRAAEEELARTRRGVDAGVLPHADLDRAQIAADAARLRVANAEAEAAHLAWRAPASGTLVVERTLAAGSEIAAGATVAEIALAGAPTVEALASASDAPALAPGLTATLLSADGARRIGTATLREAGATLAGGTTRAVFAASTTTPTALSGAGSGVVVEVALPRRSGALTLPEAAIVSGAGGAAVWVVAPGNDRPRAARRAVRLGGRGGGRVEILEGLRPGDRVATTAVAVLTAGAPVVEESATAAAAGHQP
jgi:RND family efflux transporter MFP subunit